MAAGFKEDKTGKPVYHIYRRESQAVIVDGLQKQFEEFLSKNQNTFGLIAQPVRAHA